jgi:hypothetical protein
MVILLVSTVATAILASYAFEPSNVTVEVKEPIKILECPTQLSLYPGENESFNVVVENDASLNYSATLLFNLNDTSYQTKYVTFSSIVYEILPGKQSLDAWLKVSTDAPSAITMLTVSFKRGADNGTEPPAPSTNNLTLNPSLILLGSGARWAARNGTRALFVDVKDNWAAHHLTDGADWGPWPSESDMNDSRFSIAQTLRQYGFDVDFTADIPQDLSNYDLVVVQAFWAVEPRHVQLFRSYINNGGGVVILNGVPCYFSVYCKDCWPYRAGDYPTGPGGTDLTKFQDWFGAAQYVNTGGTARLTVDNPFGTALTSGTVVRYDEGFSAAAVTGLSNDSTVLARWDNGGFVFAYTHEYGQGRLYYQAHLVNIPAQ